METEKILYVFIIVPQRARAVNSAPHGKVAAGKIWSSDQRLREGELNGKYIVCDSESVVYCLIQRRPLNRAAVLEAKN